MLILKILFFQNVLFFVYLHFVLVFIYQAQILRVMLAYLRLLVNSRDELALAQVINVPDRGLAHRQFTVLRKVAREKKMPMFQVKC